MTLTGLFFAVGNSSRSRWHFSQYTPPPRSRTHRPTQCSQYFSSIPIPRLSPSLCPLFIAPPKVREKVRYPHRSRGNLKLEANKSPAPIRHSRGNRTQGSFVLRRPAWAI